MELIENYCSNADKFGIVLQHALEDAIGDVENFRLRGLLGIETHCVTDLLPECRPPIFCYETCE